MDEIGDVLGQEMLWDGARGALEEELCTGLIAPLRIAGGVSWWRFVN